MTLPKNAVSPSTTAVFLALRGQRRPTVRSVGAAVGLASPHTTHTHLRKLRDLGLVSEGEGRRGTLRPLYEVVR